MLTRPATRRPTPVSVYCLLTLLLLSFAADPRRAVASPASEECEGDACAAVTLTFDSSKVQYLARNNSADRWVRVVASNVSSAADACLGPGKSADLPIKSIVGRYRADYTAPRCGAPE